jgi:transposase
MCMETPKDKEVPRIGRYDKRFILKIVQEVESGSPRNETIQLYNLSNSTLNEWMRDYGSAHYHNNLKRKSYSRTQKRSIVAAIEQGRMSIKQAQVAYQIKSQKLIRNWVKQEKLDLYTVIDPAMTKKKNLPKSNKEVEDLRKALQEAELRIKALNTLIDVAEEQLKTDIRKKPGAKQSKK